MDNTTKLTFLMNLADELGIDIRQLPGCSSMSTGGSYVRLAEQEIIFLDPLASIEDQIETIANSLQGNLAVEQRYLPPEIREMLDSS